MPEQETTEPEVARPPKKGFLGCSFPLLIGIVAILLAFVLGFFVGPIGEKIADLSGWTLPGWFSQLSVARPHPELPAEVVFHIFGFPITNSILGSWITIVFLVGFSYAVTRRLSLIPARLQSLVELIVESLLNFCKSVAGEKNGRRFFPIVATIFLFVAFNAWLSLLPGFGTITIQTAEGEAHLLRGANTDINMPLALALVSFVFVEYFGFKMLGIRYLGKFFSVGGLLGGLRLLLKGKLKAGFGGIMTGLINIFVGLLELLSEFIRIISFTFRLFGNMTAGEILLLIVVFLVPFVVVEVFYFLELLVGFIQALIFAALTLIFLTVAVTSHHEGETA